jgi:hypothetical protein
MLNEVKHLGSGDMVVASAEILRCRSGTQVSAQEVGAVLGMTMRGW